MNLRYLRNFGWLAAAIFLLPTTSLVVDAKIKDRARQDLQNKLKAGTAKMKNMIKTKKLVETVPGAQELADTLSSENAAGSIPTIQTLDLSFDTMIREYCQQQF